MLNSSIFLLAALVGLPDVENCRFPLQFIGQNRMSVQTSGEALAQKPHDSSNEIVRISNILELEKREFSEIVIFSLNNFLGDSFVFHFSMIEYLKQKFPGHKIKVISPHAGVLRGSEKSDLIAVPFPVRFAEFKTRENRLEHIKIISERVPGFIRSNIAKNSFVLFDLTTLDKADGEIDPLLNTVQNQLSMAFYNALRSVDAFGVGVSNLKDGKIFQGVSHLAVIAPKKLLPSELWTMANSNARRSLRGDLLGFVVDINRTFQEKNVYNSWLNAMELIFGESVFLSWDAKHLLSEEDSARADSFLHEKFLAPGPLGILNLNTFGGDKVKELNPYYAEVFESIVSQVIENHPSLKLLVSFPEPQFGPENQWRLIQFIKKYKGRVAFVTSAEREIIPSLMARSSFVVTYDSGVNHLASFLPIDRVLTFSFTEGQPDLWRRPGQDYIKQIKQWEWREMSARIVNWIDEKLVQK